MAAKSGFGTTLIGGTVGTVGNIISISGPDMTADMIDITTMDSEGGFEEVIKGMADAGELTFECNYDGSASGVADALNTAFQLKAAETWTIQFAGDADDWSASGFISGLGHAIPFDDKISQSVTITFTGVSTYALT